MSKSQDTNGEPTNELEPTPSLLEQLEDHLESTSTRLWEDRAKAMVKQLKAWGVDKGDMSVNAPYVIVDGYCFQMLDDDHIEVSKEKGRGAKIGKTLNHVIEIIRDYEK